MNRTPPLLLALALLAVPWSPHVAAQARSLAIDQFSQVIQIHADGAVEVEETLALDFRGEWNGIERDFLRAHRTADGRGGRLRYTFEGVTDAGGAPLEVEESSISGGHRLRIWVPGASDAIRTVVIRYRVTGGIRFFTSGRPGAPTEPPPAEAAPGDGPVEEEGFDEFYWNATGGAWEMPIREARVRVVLPEGVEGLGAWGYTGMQGSTEQAVDVRVQGREAAIVTTRELGEREGLTVSVAWDQGVVERPTAAQQALARVLAFWPIGLPLASLLAMFATWRRLGRDPQRRAIMVQYSPPEDLSPAEVGTLVDHRAEMHDLTATLVDLAVRGYLRIEEEEKSGFLSRLTGKTGYTFHQLRPSSRWGELKLHERRYMEGLFPAPARSVSGIAPRTPGDAAALLTSYFGAWRDARRAGRSFDPSGHAREFARSRGFPVEPEGGREEPPLQSVKLEELTNRFYTHLEGIRTGVYDHLQELGLYNDRPDRRRAKWAGSGMALIMGAGLAAALVASREPGGLLPHPIALAGGVGLSGLIVLVFSRFMGVRTEKGVRALEHVLGFKEFLEKVEAPQYARMITSPDLFERYLPHAMALQVEDRWARAFEGMLRTAPGWYDGRTGSSGFRTTDFTRQMRGLTSDAGRVMSSTPGGSSGSSGSGGGGSSGGGSGGGGGRGF